MKERRAENVVPIGTRVDRQLDELQQLRDLGRQIERYDEEICRCTRARDHLQLQFDELLNRRPRR